MRSGNPIKFKAEFLPAIMNGRKTQTRRPVDKELLETVQEEMDIFGTGHIWAMDCPYGKVGDRVGVLTDIATNIQIEITCVRVERVQEISATDALAEGVSRHYGDGEARSPSALKMEFRSRWDEIYDLKGFGWNKNPWVWVINFRRIA